MLVSQKSRSETETVSRNELTFSSARCVYDFFHCLRAASTQLEKKLKVVERVEDEDDAKSASDGGQSAPPKKRGRRKRRGASTKKKYFGLLV